MRKGTIQQAFIYILAILVIGFIVIIGARSFASIQERTCQAERITFQRELAAALDRNVVWGREERVALSKPCDYEALCLVDARSISYGLTLTAYNNMVNTGKPTAYRLDTPPSTLKEGIIKNSVEEKIEKNIFLIKKDVVEPIDYDEKIIITTSLTGPDYCDSTICQIQHETNPITQVSEDIPLYAFCIPARAGKFSFTLQGQGKSVMAGP